MAHVIIEEFKPQYEAEAKELIHGVLAELGLLNMSWMPELELDIQNIERTYTGRSSFWVALDGGGAIVGTVGIKERDKDIADLKRMFLAPAYRGKGVAQRLLLDSLAFAKRQGYVKVCLDTDKHVMLRAHRFYEKCGFVRTGEDEHRYFYERMI